MYCLWCLFELCNFLSHIFCCLSVEYFKLHMLCMYFVLVSFLSFVFVVFVFLFVVVLGQSSM